MSLKHKIIEVTKENISEYPQVICFINPKHEFHSLKIDWLMDRFEEGLRIKLLYLEEAKKIVGFVEYIPGEFCWRAVDAKDYMFIHCIWTNGKKYQHQGLGKILIDEVENDSKDKNGVVVVSSDKAFMATKEIFLKNDYTLIDEIQKNQLLVKNFKTGDLPSFNDIKSNLLNKSGWQIFYSKQCPWVARFIQEMKPIMIAENLDIKITEIKTASEAQNAPSIYSTFNLIHNGKILSDRYISVTRFKNIIKKEKNR